WIRTIVSQVSLPHDVEVVDTMIWFPTPTAAASKVEHLFKGDVSLPEGRDPVEYTVEQMERFNIGRAVVDVDLDPVGASALKLYPKSIIDFANTRGADKVLFAGYFAVGLTWERIFAELAELPLRDEVWPRFLRDNACQVLGLA